MWAANSQAVLSSEKCSFSSFSRVVPSASEKPAPAPGLPRVTARHFYRGTSVPPARQQDGRPGTAEKPNTKWLEEASGPFCHMVATELLGLGSKLVAEYKIAEERWQRSIRELEFKHEIRSQDGTKSDWRSASKESRRTLGYDEDGTPNRATGRNFTVLAAKCYSMAAASGSPGSQPIYHGGSQYHAAILDGKEFKDEPTDAADGSQLGDITEEARTGTSSDLLSCDHRPSSSWPVQAGAELAFPRSPRMVQVCSLPSQVSAGTGMNSSIPLKNSEGFSACSATDGPDGPRFLMWRVWEECEGTRGSYVQSRALSRTLTNKALGLNRHRFPSPEGTSSLCQSMHTAQSLQEELAAQQEAESSDDSDTEPASLRRLPDGRAGRWFRTVLQPSSKIRIIWDALTVMCVIYESFAIPLLLLDLGDLSALTVMTWLTRLFWTADLPMQFFSGQMRSDGGFEKRHWIVKKRYFTTWFPLDFAVVAVDWLDVITDRADELVVLRALKVARLIRIMRLVRVLRVHKTPTYIKSLLHLLGGPEFVVVVLKLMKLVLFIVWLNHMNACLWYSLAWHNSSRNWLDENGYRSESTAFKYLTAYHWSLSGFVGAMEVSPVNVRERLYSVVALIASFLLAVSLISSMTSAFTRLHIVAAKKTVMMTELRQYIQDNGISKELGVRLQRNAEMAMEAQAGNEEVALLKLVSPTILLELNFEIFLPMLKYHPFLSNYCTEHKGLMRQVCNEALSKMHMCKGDVLFVLGENCTLGQMYIVMSGKLAYHHHSMATVRIKPGEWAAEAVLWTPWVHCGTARVVQDCVLCVVNAEQFQQVALHSLIEAHPAWAYASAFVRKLNDTPDGMLSDLAQVNMDLVSLADGACPVRRH